MKLAHYISRALFLILAIVLLVRLNTRANNQVETIAEFKVKTIEKLRADSLDSEHKFDLVLNETTRFVDSSSHVREGIHNLIGLFGLFAIFELTFLILEKRNPGRQNK